LGGVGVGSSDVDVVVPLPSAVLLVGDNTERADAHDKKSCRWVSYQVQTRARGSDGDWTTKAVTRYPWVCTKHWWERALIGGSSGALCAGV